MSDLSSPPLTLVPVEGAPPAGSDGFAWPTPPYACYAAPVPLKEPEPCQIEGMNGRLMNGALLEMDPADGVARCASRRRASPSAALQLVPQAHADAPLPAWTTAPRPASCRNARRWG